MPRMCHVASLLPATGDVPSYLFTSIIGIFGTYYAYIGDIMVFALVSIVSVADVFSPLCNRR